MCAFFGAGGAVITLAASYSPSDVATSPASATCTFGLTAAGDVTVNGADVGDWITPKGGFGNYECNLTVNSGSTPTGSATATWLNLGTNRSWTISQSGVGTNTSNCTIQIRLASSGAVLDSATVTFSATVSP